MGVAVLSPQDCLKGHLPRRNPLISPAKHTKHVSQANPNPNPNPTRSARNQPNRRRRSPPKIKTTVTTSEKSPLSLPEVQRSPLNELVAGQVRILKRGEDLSSVLTDRDSLPDDAPQSVPTGIVLSQVGKVSEESDRRSAGFYAGSAYIASPPPSSLPLPAFFTRKSVVKSNHQATSDLRRILRLDS